MSGLSGWRAIAVGLALALSGCGENQAAKSPQAEAVAKPLPEFIQLPGLDNWAMIVPAGAAPNDFTLWAKDQCGAAAICGVYAWSDKAAAARALPMTDPEAASMVFSYGLNRNSGFEQSLWNCEAFPQPEPDRCLASFE